MRHSEWAEEIKACADYLKNNADVIVQENQFEQKITITITITHEASAMVEVKKDILPKEVWELQRRLAYDTGVNENCRHFKFDGQRECWECEKTSCAKYWYYHGE